MPRWIVEVGADYAASGLAGRLAPGERPAVLVVDLQLGFTDPTNAPGADLDDVVLATRELLDCARAVNTPIIYTTIAFDRDRLDQTLWLRKMPAMRTLVAGEPTTKIDDRLGRRPAEPLLPKQAASAFNGTSLDEMLHRLEVDSVVLCGATTSGCIRATAVDACACGWPTFVPRECVGDRAAGPHEANLLDIDAKYGDVIDLSRAQAMLTVGAS